MDEELLPTGNMKLVKDSPYDLSEGTVIGAKEIDIAYLAHKNGIYFLQFNRQIIKLEYDPDFFKYLQVFIPPDRMSLAVEPVSAATNAFNIPHLGRREIAPGEKIKTELRISYEE
ncbi:MAG: hypothetical protein HQK83_19050 [Fibrobacteria bacterium]|nr:hypothetical protein [Fibrobacteria bacterium]